MGRIILSGSEALPVAKTYRDGFEIGSPCRAPALGQPRNITQAVSETPEHFLIRGLNCDRDLQVVNPCEAIYIEIGVLKE